VAVRALQKHELYDDEHKPIYILAGTELQALQVIEREQADAVFCYKTDLATVDLPGFEMYPLKTDDAPPIFYTVAISRLAKNPTEARQFIDYCTGETGRAIWAKHGFETN
jgi:ABC-type molybdate transport system substrate-binding protein